MDFGDYETTWVDPGENQLHDANNLYHNNGDGTFEDQAECGFRGGSRFLAFGVRFRTSQRRAGKTSLSPTGT